MFVMRILKRFNTHGLEFGSLASEVNIALLTTTYQSIYLQMIYLYSSFCI